MESGRPRTEPHFFHGALSRLSHTCDLKTATLVATLPGAWHCRVNAGTGLPSLSIL